MTTKRPAVRDDPRVQELAKCVLFTVNNFPNSMILDAENGKATTLHAWFTKALRGAGYKVRKPNASATAKTPGGRP